jgi:hypothetical protein
MIIMELIHESFPQYYAPYMYAVSFGYEHIILINGKGGLPEQPNLDVPLESYTVK